MRCYGEKRDYYYFFLVVAILASMDGFAFYFPHNQGFFSLTYGPDRFVVLGVSADAWHMLKRMMLLILIIKDIGIEYRDKWWWFALFLFVGIALGGQVLIYNGIIKLT